MKKLLITDLDDTLYSWINFFIPAFYCMVDEISNISGIDKETLLHEYKAYHQHVGSVEYPFATLHLPSIKIKYEGKTETEIKNILNPAFHKFNSVRKHELKLYEDVYSTLDCLYNKNIIIIGYTESNLENGYYRLKKLSIDKYFKHVYVGGGSYLPFSDSNKIIKIAEKKPNAEVLKQICRHEDIATEEALYVGDSLTKDMLMAIRAGITAVWINRKNSNIDFYNKLVKISSWTDDDFNRENNLKQQWINENMSPDYEISSFSQILNIIFRDIR